ncbi:MAG: hypothetical protein LBC85_03715 [Fibromonadaceae bacterium]|nr:hypothetical protein [Fibromonadaceae bacterium]
MEYDQYLSRFMGKNDRFAQLAYAEEQGEARGEARGIAKVLEYLKQGHTVAEAEQLLKA